MSVPSNNPSLEHLIEVPFSVPNQLGNKQKRIVATQFEKKY